MVHIAALKDKENEHYTAAVWWMILPEKVLRVLNAKSVLMI
jgi:hypothetical protein